MWFDLQLRSPVVVDLLLISRSKLFFKMKCFVWKAAILLLAFFCICFGAEKDSKTSDRPKVHKDDLSDKEHFPEGEHSSEYDHEAFLGDQKQEFDELSPDEAKKRLKTLTKKVDKNSDGFVSIEELKQWVKSVFDSKLFEGVDVDVKEKDLDKDGSISWNEYLKGTYGDENDEEGDNQDFLKRDKRRFDAADKNKDGKLDADEYGHFLHPESSPEMSDLHVLETMEGKFTPKMPEPWEGGVRLAMV